MNSLKGTVQGSAISGEVRGVGAVAGKPNAGKTIHGNDGKSAYEYALAGGYTGTEEEFAQKLAEENPTREEFESHSHSFNDLNDKPFEGTEIINGEFFNGAVSVSQTGGDYMFPELKYTADITIPLENAYEIGNAIKNNKDKVTFLCTNTTFGNDVQKMSFDKLYSFTSGPGRSVAFRLRSYNETEITIRMCEGSNYGSEKLAFSDLGIFIVLDKKFMPDSLDDIVLNSSSGSGQKFRITVNDNGAISAKAIS